MAFQRPMGADSVAYHRDTVINRADDYPGVALGYYTERGESPLVWGGSGAVRLGLEGNVRLEHYEDLFGPGGAQDPVTGERLAKTTRPGLELVVSAHKSVAELGVMGRVEDMHAILDAERDGTMAYLDQLARNAGGRRGRAATTVPTSGLVYASTRHATSRAADPLPHDHVLIANVVEMLDAKGGWKGADTALLRDHVHAATAYGRMCAAKVAVDLGYGIVPDEGPSGRLGHWAIAGVPELAMEIHSKRSAEIADEMERVGFDSYRARGVAARNSRTAKRHQAVDDLMYLWRDELLTAGITLDGMAAEVDRASYARIAPDLTPERAQAVVTELLAPDGRLAQGKVFARRDVIVAAAPQLFGLDPSELSGLVQRVLDDPSAIPLVGVPGARQRCYVPASVLATEQAIAAFVDAGRQRSNGRTYPRALAGHALVSLEEQLGRPLTPGQERAIEGICSSGRAIDVVLGVAGAGKTTALAGVRMAFERTGYTVIGTATSGQAARTLEHDAGMTASTLASLLWRLDHHQVVLTPHTVVILDETGMTDDPDLLRLLTAADLAGAKVVMVGDDRQLGAVGPGGALGAVIGRYEPGVWVLDENVRQPDHTERVALEELRAGSIDAAVGWMAANGRIETGRDKAEVLGAAVDGWLADVDGGRDTMMLAWRRANVNALNKIARQAYAERGWLDGPEIKAEGGRRYRAGDRIVTLAPGAHGQILTSERGSVVLVDTSNGSLRARMEDGRLQDFPRQLTGSDHMAHGYAVTVHRSQGATADTCHRLEDGGGRELAYVSMSRARHCSTVYVIADDLDQARDDLTRDWSHERRQHWVIDTGTACTDPLLAEQDCNVAPTMRAALRHARLSAERQAVEAAVPPDVSIELADRRRSRGGAEKALATLDKGSGPWVGTVVGDAVDAVEKLEDRRQRLVWRMNGSDGRERRAARRELREIDHDLVPAREHRDELVEPQRHRLTARIDDLDEQVRDLERQQSTRTTWLKLHPEVARRLHNLDHEIASVGEALTVERNTLDGIEPEPVERDPRQRQIDEVLARLPAPERDPQPWWQPSVSIADDFGLGL